MQMPENYLAKAEQCLRDAEDAPECLRLHFILMAQRWFELAEFFAPFRRMEGTSDRQHVKSRLTLASDTTQPRRYQVRGSDYDLVHSEGPSRR